METPHIGTLLALVDNIASAKAGKDGVTSIELTAEVKDQLIKAAQGALAEMQQISVYVAQGQQPLFDMFAASALQGLTTDPEITHEDAASNAAMFAMHMLKARDEYVMVKVEDAMEEAPQPETKPEEEDSDEPAEVITTPVPEHTIEAE
jgi:hypothetical protein